jgi:GMP synthase (glutamine-hydrolysing)
VLENFLHARRRLSPPTGRWQHRRGADRAVREQVGEDGVVICGLSGGVDSAVAAALVQRAIGDQLTCVFVDHGLLRQGEAEQVERTSSPPPGSTWSPSTPSERFLDALPG